MEQTIQTAHRSFAKGVLGRTGPFVGRLGLAASYGAPPAASEEAFERGCNYFYIGSGRRRANMKTAIRNICKNGHREGLKGCAGLSVCPAIPAGCLPGW
ncbi:MAG: hypothetical protein SWC96_12595 [Thermodesulfobacteriota bacterium]|nr:hypothetical protein [Thermodesulfobacteriota bacterium]